MRRTGVWLVGIYGLALACGTAAAAEKAKAPTPGATPAAQSGKEPAKEEKIAYTFSDQAKMEEFTKLWQQRQGVVLRVTVLQAYMSQEQAAFTELNTKLTTDYKLDPTKNYFLDSKRRVLVEHELPSATPPAPAAQTAPPPAARSTR